jgi:hypothetical protein
MELFRHVVDLTCSIDRMVSHKSEFGITGITTIYTTLSLYVPLRTITKEYIHPQDAILHLVRREQPVYLQKTS